MDGAYDVNAGNTGTDSVVNRMARRCLPP